LVWNKPEIGRLFADKYVMVRFTSRDNEFKILSKRYNVRRYPTVLFLDQRGEEVDRIFFNNPDRSKYTPILKDFVGGDFQLAALREKYNRKPDDVWANLRLARKYVSRYEMRACFPHYSKVLKYDPSDSKGYMEEASYYVAFYNMRFRQNIRPLESFVETCEGGEFLEKSSLDLIGWIKDKEDPLRTSRRYEEAIKKLPRSTALRKSYLKFILSGQLADLYPRGERLARDLIKLDPKRGDLGYMFLGKILERKGDWAELLAFCREACAAYPAKTPHFARDFVFKVHVSRKRDLYDAAIELARKSVEITEKDATLWFFMGLLLEEKGEYQKAAGPLQKACDLYPDRAYYRKALERVKDKSDAGKN
jgi:tetratricopeptide (TPR) repeat protein